MPPLTRRFVPVLAIAAGAAAANLYYTQPLLADLRQEFQVGAAVVGWVPTLAQLGYALGMALVVPLAADLAPPERRGQVVGTVMSGLLVGILLSRTFSGLVGDAAGWRVVFWAAAAVTAVVWLLLRSTLPVEAPRPHLPYGALLRSCLELPGRHPDLRLHAALGGLLFAAFSTFWVTLVLHLSTLPGGYGARAAGLYGVVGVVGAIAVPLVGRVADARRDRRINAVGCALVLASFGLLYLGGGSLLLIGLAVVVLDFGTQASHVNNQARIFALDPAARSRLNTIYMVTYFAGGAAGSLAGTTAWEHAGWGGVCATGAGLSGLALLLLGAARLRNRATALHIEGAGNGL